MALSPTIFKFDVALADVDRNQYHQLNLTIAQHPSETSERMMARLLAYCLNVDEGLAFAGDLSASEAPDIWQLGLDNQILQWIEVGEPSAERLKKASRIARQVLVYSFNSKSEHWWSRNGQAITASKVSVYQFDWLQIKRLAGLAQRTLSLSISVSDQAAFIASESDSFEMTWRHLRDD